MSQETAGVVVNGSMEIHPEDRDHFIALVAQNVADTEGVEGCISYTFTVNVRNPHRFHNIEAWTDYGALEKHMKSTLMQTAFAEVKTLRILSRDVVAYTVTNITKL